MKKGLRKLILSGTALAAVAATLGTSTYAWYTTNPTVNANSIIASSSDTGASSIFISRDTAATKNWSQTVTFAASDFASDKLVPLQIKAAESFTDLKDGDAGDTDYVKVPLFFKTSKTSANVDLYIKSITLTNTTTTLPTADNLLAGNDTTITTSAYGVSNEMATYSVDFTRALSMQIYNKTTSTVKQAIDLASYNSSYKTGTNTVTNGKAHAYYNKVMPGITDTNGKNPGEDGYVFTPALSDDAITAGKNQTAALQKAPIASLDKDSAVTEIDFYIYLNGWSDFCYDACQGQTFSINMSFTSDESAAIGATV